jgi:YhcN/YlaJ family sporulation lipoprotein
MKGRWKLRHTLERSGASLQGFCKGVHRMSIVLLLVVAAGAIAGCGRVQNQGNEARADNGQNIRAQQTAPDQASSPSADTETRLEDLARSIPQVTDAKCVILGNTAIVGITVDPGMDRSRVNTIKYSVAEAFRKDPAGINAFVTADMGLGERIRHVRDDIRNGRPFTGFAQELGDIIGRIAPQLPKDIQPMENRRDDTDAQEQQFQSNDL